MLESATMKDTDLREWLIASITQRFRSNADFALSDYIFSNSLFHSIAVEQVGFMFAHRTAIADYLYSTSALSELVGHCIDSTKRYTYERNQFVNFTAEYDGLLDSEYVNFIGQIRNALRSCKNEESLGTEMVSILQAHHERLRLIMVSYCVTYQDNDLHKNPLLRTVPCEEYSTGFQLSILGLTLDELIEPVLDVGCGSNGALVYDLRERGICAYGVDRLAPDGPCFFRTDWFDFDYSSQPCGSVLAHQSLSTHFIYAYLQQPVSIEKFAKLTMKILGELQKNSFLCYAPGMPFFESQIEKMTQFSIERRKISMRMPEVEQIAYSTKICRIAQE
jgi:hypothetical protein